MTLYAMVTAIRFTHDVETLGLYHTVLVVVVVVQMYVLT